MIKVAELRIGNLINHKIEGITKVDVMSYSGNEDDRVNDFALKFYEGIPVTEEWLLKFGFENNLSDDTPEYRLTNKWVKRDFEIYSDWIGKQLIYDRTSIQYVHQLQNLYFALCGKELTLNSQPIKK